MEVQLVNKHCDQLFGKATLPAATVFGETFVADPLWFVWCEKVWCLSRKEVGIYGLLDTKYRESSCFQTACFSLGWQFGLVAHLSAGRHCGICVQAGFFFFFCQMWVTACARLSGTWCLTTNFILAGGVFISSELSWTLLYVPVNITMSCIFPFITAKSEIWFGSLQYSSFKQSKGKVCQLHELFFSTYGRPNSSYGTRIWSWKGFTVWFVA